MTWKLSSSKSQVLHSINSPQSPHSSDQIRSILKILTMSIETTPTDKDGSRYPLASSSTPLTTANLAAHEAAIAATPKKEPNNMQRWLADTCDKHNQLREARDWGQLVARDGLAKDVEIVIRGGNSAGVE